MEPTIEALKDLVKQIATSAKKNVRKNGGVDPVAFFITATISESEALVLDMTSEENAAKMRQLMREKVAELNPVAVVAIVGGDMAIVASNEEGEPSKILAKDSRVKQFISVQASSPIANHEVLIEYSLKGKRVEIGEEYGVIAEGGGCEFTRDLWGPVN